MGQRLDFEEIADLLHDHLRRQGALAAHHRHRVHATVERQTADEADDALLGVGQCVDELGDVVFQERFAVRREECNGGVIVGGVGANEAEVANLAFLVEAHAPQSGGHRAVLGVRKGFGIENGHVELAARHVAILLQQCAHALEIATVVGCCLTELFGIVEANADRLVDGAQHHARTLRHGKQVLLG